MFNTELDDQKKKLKSLKWKQRWNPSLREEYLNSLTSFKNKVSKASLSSWRDFCGGARASLEPPGYTGYCLIARPGLQAGLRGRMVSFPKNPWRISGSWWKRTFPTLLGTKSRSFRERREDKESERVNSSLNNQRGYGAWAINSFLP